MNYELEIKSEMRNQKYYFGYSKLKIHHFNNRNPSVETPSLK